MSNEAHKMNEKLMIIKFISPCFTGVRNLLSFAPIVMKTVLVPNFLLKKILGDVSYFDALRKNMFLILRISYLYINSKKKEDFTPVSYLDILHLC